MMSAGVESAERSVSLTPALSKFITMQPVGLPVEPDRNQLCA
jgi:hypothetical protein